MFCPKCGKINSDTEAKCTGCGAELHEESAVIEKPAKKAWKIVLAVAVVAVVVAVAVILLSGCGHAIMPDVNDRITY